MPETTTEISDETIAEVKAKHAGADLRLLDAGGEQIIVKVPNRGEWKRFRTMLTSGDATVASETFVQGCLVYPSTAELGAMLERLPALGQVFAERLAAMAGAGRDATEKKL